MNAEISQAEFERRVNENTAEYKRQKSRNSFDIKRFHGFDAVAGELGRYELSKKPQDILGSVELGFLPILRKNTGVDAMRLGPCGFIGIELKSSYTDERKFVRTERGAVYSATPGKIINGEIRKNDTTSLKSNYNASYSIVGNIEAKYVETYLLIIDSRTDRLIDCHVMTADNIKNYLSKRIIPNSGSVQIKLSIFEKYGYRYTDTILPILGFDAWKESLIPNMPLVKVIS